LKSIFQSSLEILLQYVASELFCFCHFNVQFIIEFRVLINKEGQFFSNLLKISSVVSDLFISIFCISNISHSSIHSDIYIIVNHVSLSQFFIASWIGLAHLYLGRILP
jgi:hypothetical protein